MNKFSVKAAFSFFICCFVFICLFAFASCAKNNHDYLSTKEEFFAAVNSGQEVIYVGDIDFGADTQTFYIQKNVTIIGKKEYSFLKNAHVKISGGVSKTDAVSVNITNVLFDGCADTNVKNLDSTKTFEECFTGLTSDSRCISANGFLSLCIDNCAFTRYLSKKGCAVYLDYKNQSSPSPDMLNFTATNCDFFNNYCYSGVLCFDGNNNNNLTVKDCNFYNNKALQAAAVFAHGTNIRISNCTVFDNIAQDFGGSEAIVTDLVSAATLKLGQAIGVALDDCNAIITACRFEGNKGYYGGALSLDNSSALVDSCSFVQNSASQMGGALMIASAKDSPSYITNSLFTGNYATNGGSVGYVLLSDYAYKKVNAGIVEFSLCSFANNTCDKIGMIVNDTKTYSYIDGAEWRTQGENGEYVYNVHKDDTGNLLYNENSAMLELLGCIVVDEGYTATENSYTLACLPNSAEQLGIKIGTQRAEITTSKGSDSYIKIPHSTVSSYANGLYSSSGKSYIAGVNTADKNMAIPLWAVITISLIAIAMLFFGEYIILISKASKMKNNSEIKPENKANIKSESIK